jgi:hypothetical protein
LVAGGVKAWSRDCGGGVAGQWSKERGRSSRKCVKRHRPAARKVAIGRRGFQNGFLMAEAADSRVSRMFGWWRPPFVLSWRGVLKNSLSSYPSLTINLSSTVSFSHIPQIKSCLFQLSSRPLRRASMSSPLACKSLLPRPKFFGSSLWGVIRRSHVLTVI